MLTIALIVNKIKKFYIKCDIIVANRICEEFSEVKDKVLHLINLYLTNTKFGKNCADSFAAIM